MQFKIKSFRYLLLSTVVFLLACNMEIFDGSEPAPDNPDDASGVSNPDDLMSGPDQPDGVTAKPLNDTGVIWCHDNVQLGSGNGSAVSCYSSGTTAQHNGVDAENDLVPAGQDAVYGRDSVVQPNKLGYGNAGFDYTKVDANDNPLGDLLPDWDCVLDHHTGLMWEAKSNDDGLHDKDNTYTWHSTDYSTNGGDPGVPLVGDCTGYGGCDTKQYIELVNAQSLCTYQDWRLPSRSELLSIVNYGMETIATDPMVFQDTLPWRYWTGDTKANAVGKAWTVDFSDGSVNQLDSYKTDVYHVRLVRTAF